ncbi:MAG: glucose-6-phosphate isomerase, partial [Candidatus Omnitrophota bacterium]|nr:glucose-6-phosphate isomerase [Candidatus Omnitrophota bacterium]
MKKISFDFNNLFSQAVGKAHGVGRGELNALLPAARMAGRHLETIISRPASRIALNLEWTQLPFQDAAAVEKIQRLGGEISRNFTNVIFLGIGGSYLGLKAAQDALAPAYYNEFSAARKGRPRIYFEGNNLDPDTLQALLQGLNSKKTFIVVISKSGETIETKAAFLVMEEWLKKAVGKKYGRQILVITDPESGSLRGRVKQEQAKDRLSFRSLPLLKGVGGRFSELNMGLLHLAIIGVKIHDVLDGARDMGQRCRQADLWHNPAYLYAALHSILYREKGKSIAILMPFSETLKSTADWYVQLLAESLGKKYARRIEIDNGQERWLQDKQRVAHLGRTPISSRGSNDLHSIQQNNIEGENNKVITFIRVERFRKEIKIPGKRDILSGKRFSELIKLAQEATEWALVQEARPNCTICLPEVSPYHWGGLLFFFEMATAIEGELLDINAFDQPGVEGYKNYMY